MILARTHRVVLPVALSREAGTEEEVGDGQQQQLGQRTSFFLAVAETLDRDESGQFRE